MVICSESLRACPGPGLKGHNGLQRQRIVFVHDRKLKENEALSLNTAWRPGQAAARWKSLTSSWLSPHPPKITWPVICRHHLPFQYLQLWICCFRSSRRIPGGWMTPQPSETTQHQPPLGCTLAWNHPDITQPGAARGEHNPKFKTEAVIGYVFICYPSIFNTEDITLLAYGKLTRLGFGLGFVFSTPDFHPSSKCHQWWHYSSW